MTKADDHRRRLAELDGWEPFLLAESGLPVTSRPSIPRTIARFAAATPRTIQGMRSRITSPTSEMIANSHGASITHHVPPPGAASTTVFDELLTVIRNQASTTWVDSAHHQAIGATSSASPSVQNVTTIVNVMTPMGIRRRW